VVDKPPAVPLLWMMKEHRVRADESGIEGVCTWLQLGMTIVRRVDMDDIRVCCLKGTEYGVLKRTAGLTSRARVENKPGDFRG
jgi:hypothetical protein